MYTLVHPRSFRLMIDLKTTTAFKMTYIPLKIICESGKETYDLDHLCYLIGQYFQIKDDYINLKCDDFQKLKGACY